jgi:hypothetical protein
VGVGVGAEGGDLLFSRLLLHSQLRLEKEQGQSKKFPLSMQKNKVQHITIIQTLTRAGGPSDVWKVSIKRSGIYWEQKAKSGGGVQRIP